MAKTKIEKGKSAVKKATKVKPAHPTIKRTSASTTITTTAKTTIIKATAPPPRVPTPFAWKEAFILGLKFDDPAKKSLLEANHSFYNIHSLLENPHKGCDAYVYNCPEASGSAGELVPVIVAILVPGDETPPSFLGRRNQQQGTEDILSMKELNLAWREEDTTSSKPRVARASARGRGGGGRVFTLQSSLQRMTKTAMGAMGEATLYNFEHATPFIMKPSLLDAEEPLFTFEVTLPNGEVVDGEYHGRSEEDKNKFIHRFLRTWAEEGMDEESVEHFNLVKAAVDAEIQKQLDEHQTKKNLLQDYDDDMLEAMVCIKIYPDSTPRVLHSQYVSKYYKNAVATYPLARDDNTTNGGIAPAMDIWGNPM